MSREGHNTTKATPLVQITEITLVVFSLSLRLNVYIGIERARLILDAKKHAA